MKQCFFCIILAYGFAEQSLAEVSKQCRDRLHLVPLSEEQNPPVPRNQLQMIFLKTYQILELKEEITPSDFVEHIKYLEQTLKFEHISWEERLFQSPTPSNWVNHFNRLIKLKFIIAIYYVQNILGLSFEGLENNFFQFVKAIDYQNPRYYRSSDKEGIERPLEPVILEDFLFSLMAKLPSHAKGSILKIGKVLTLKIEDP